MLGERNPQRGLYNAATELGEESVSRMGFHGKLATEGPKIFQDSNFAGAYCTDNGRPSVPPSLLAQARLLQHYDGVSDAEVIERCTYDLRWKVALDLGLASVDAPFVKSTFQAFRVRLTLHAKEGLAFDQSIKAAREAGLLPKRLRVALDSSPVRGRGAVKDTFNLLSDAIVAVVRSIAGHRGAMILERVDPREVAREAGVERHLEEPSIKGSEIVDWDDEAHVREFLGGLLEDCERVVVLAEQDRCATEEVALLQKIVADDVEPEGPEGGPNIRQAVARGRTVSVHDPEMKHGHKSRGKAYTGHKAHVSVDTTSGVVTAVEMTSPSEPEGGQVQGLVEQTRERTEREVEDGLGDCAYSSRNSLAQAAEAGIELHTKMPSPPKGRFGPRDFNVSKDGKEATCPAGIVSEEVKRRKDGHLHLWSKEACGSCPMKESCTQAKAGRRTLLVPPDFHGRRERERYARSEAGRGVLRGRIAVEHAIGRLKNLGAGRARYFGRSKTKAQWLWAAAVANLSLIWTKEATAEA